MPCILTNNNYSEISHNFLEKNNIESFTFRKATFYVCKICYRYVKYAIEENDSMVQLPQSCCKFHITVDIN